MEVVDLRKNLSDDVLSLIDSNKWNQALTKGTYEEDDSIIRLYLHHLTEPTEKWKMIKYDKIKPLEDVLVKIFSNLGIKEANNPFIAFISIYMGINKNYNLTYKNLIQLNNLYAEGNIDYGDISGRGTGKYNHIIFNPNLYELPSGDIKFMINMYEWLSIQENLKRLNFSVMSENEVPQEFSGLSWISGLEGNIKNQDVELIRNSILFKEPEKPITSELNSPEDVDDIIQLASYTSNENTDNELSSITKITNSLDIEDKLNYFKSLLKNDENKELIKSLLK